MAPGWHRRQGERTEGAAKAGTGGRGAEGGPQPWRPRWGRRKDTAGSRSSRKTAPTRSASRWWRSATSLAGGAPAPSSGCAARARWQVAVLLRAVLFCLAAGDRACAVCVRQGGVLRHPHQPVDGVARACRNCRRRGQPGMRQGPLDSCQPRAAGVLQLRALPLFCPCAARRARRVPRASPPENQAAPGVLLPPGPSALDACGRSSAYAGTPCVRATA